jgi:CRP/FNR family transcriptional regulator, cyclic AMP receptor protein
MVMDSNLIKALNKIPLLEILSAKTTELISKLGKEINLNAGDYLFKEGDHGRKMYFILQGELEIFKKNSTVAIRKVGEFIGEMALIESKPRSASAKASRSSTLFEIDQKVFQNHLFSNARVIQEMLRTLSNRAREDLESHKKNRKEISSKKNLLRKNSFFFEEASNEFFLVNPSSFKILYANGKACKTLGYKSTKIKSLKFYNLFSGFTLIEIKKLTAPLISGKKNMSFYDGFHIKKDGSKIYSPFKIYLKEALGISCFLVASTGEESLNSILTDLPKESGLLSIINFEGKLIFQNPLFFKTFKTKIGELLPESLIDLIKRHSTNFKHGKASTKSDFIIPNYETKKEQLKIKATRWRSEHHPSDKPLWILRAYLPESTSSQFKELLTNSGLTPREIEISFMVLEGLNKNEIANRSCISPLTVKTHLQKIFYKMKVHSLSELVLTLSQLKI